MVLRILLRRIRLMYSVGRKQRSALVQCALVAMEGAPERRKTRAGKARKLQKVCAVQQRRIVLRS